MFRRLLPVCLCFLSGAAAAEEGDPARDVLPPPVLLDDFAGVSGWSAHPADGVSLALVPDGGALRLDVDFVGGGGYAVVRKVFPVDLPADYAFTFRVRGEIPPNHLEFKLLDESGQNVWWAVRRDVVFDGAWRTFTLKKRHITFAWGPAGGGELARVASIEFAVTAGSGGRGSVWLDDLILKPLRVPGAAPPEPRVVASSEAPDRPARAALDADAATWWSPASGDATPALLLDFGEDRELGGIVLDWVEGRHPRRYRVEGDDGDGGWATLFEARSSNGGRDYLYLPETETGKLRLRCLDSAGPDELALRGIDVKPIAWSATRQAFFQNVAADAPRGTYPRGMSGEQAYWTVTGADADPEDVLVGEDGAVEVGKGGFTLEPFLVVDGRLVTWNEASPAQALADGALPVPTVTWRAGGLELAVTAAGIGEPGRSSLLLRYRLRNTGAAPAGATLYAAIRPFQVNPPSQFLNTPGGTSEIRLLRWDAARKVVEVNGARRVCVCGAAPEFGAARFEEGDIVGDWLRLGSLPASTTVEDGFGAASGALAVDGVLAPGGTRDLVLVVPLHDAAPGPPAPEVDAGAWADARLDAVAARWRERLDRVTLDLPPSAAAMAATVRSQIAYVLVNRAGPAIQPGTRAYARSWIRDGALTSSALLRMGQPEAARAFLEWYAPNQYANGKAPCVVDWRGADPVPEHDSTGEFIFLVAEVFRYTGDRELAERLFPRVLRGVAYLDSLALTRRTLEYESPENRPFFGLLPESISHEGYSAKPMHSYWDDFWAVRGLRDAARLAEALGHGDDAARCRAVRDRFEADLAASIAAAMTRHGIDYVPGCADLGDFDATSTTVALDPAGAEALLPPGALDRTFDRYDANFSARAAGASWDAFTPYEVRTIGAYVHLGRRERAHDLAAFFLEHRYPASWNQWPEVVWSRPREPRFLGDLPHTWVGSDFVRAVLDMLLYVERDRDRLVAGAGVPARWLDEGGAAARGLPTPWGAADLRMTREDGVIVVRLGGALAPPPGGILVRAPLAGAPRSVSVNGRPAAAGPDGSILVREVPVEIRIEE